MDIPYDLLKIVSGFLTKPHMKLLDYIPKDELNWGLLSENPNAIDLLEKHPDKIAWHIFIFNPNFRQVMRICEKYSNISKWDLDLGDGNLSLTSPFLLKNIHARGSYDQPSYVLFKNPDAIDVLEKYNNVFSMEDWKGISENPRAIHLLEDRRAKIHWHNLYENPNPEIIRILEKKNLKKINWNMLSMNPNAITFLEKHLDKVNWSSLSCNPNAIHLLEKYPDNIDWYYLSKNPNAIHILEKYPKKINWRKLSQNPNAIHLLEKYPKKIDHDTIFYNPNLLQAMHLIKPEQKYKLWEMLSNNPSIFEIDRIQYNKDIITKSNNIDSLI